MVRAQSAATFLPTTNLFYKVARLGEPLIQPCVITSKKATEQYDCFSEDINWPFESPDSDTRQGGGRKKRAVWLKNLMTKRFHLLQIIWVCFEAEWKTHTLNRPSSSAYCRGSFHLGDLFDTLMRNDSIEQVEGVFLGGGACVSDLRILEAVTLVVTGHIYFLFFFAILRIEILSSAVASSHFWCLFYSIMDEYI